MPKPFGYYLGDGKVGNHTEEFFPYTNVYMAWVFNGYYKGDSPDSYYARMEKCVERAAKAGKLIYLGLNCQREEDRTKASIRRAIKIVKPYWNQLYWIDIADEIEVSRQEAKALIRKVRDVVAEEGLSYKPLGMTFTTDQSLFGDIITIDLLDFVNLECYPDFHLQYQDQGPARNIEYIQDVLSRARERLDPDTPVWYTLCGFDRNNKFKTGPNVKVNEDNLADLNWKSYKITRVNYRTIGWLVFNYARPTTEKGADGVTRIVPGSGGTKFYPKVKEQHIRIAKELGIVV